MADREDVENEPTIEELGSYDDYFEQVVAAGDEEQQERVQRVVYIIFGVLLLISILLLLFVGFSVFEYVFDFFKNGVFG